MVGQVGGISSQKKPLLTLKPDYILKPLITDHRGIREIAFYEAIKVASTKSKNVDKNYHAFLTGKTKSTQVQASPPPSQSTSSRTRNIVGEVFDTFAMALSIFLHDPVVLESESALRKAWRGIKRETEMLAKMTAPYYGVIGQSTVDRSTPFGVAEEAHLLLQDLTINFRKPCVMDLKMGDQTYVSWRFEHWSENRRFQPPPWLQILWHLTFLADLISLLLTCRNLTQPRKSDHGNLESILSKLNLDSASSACASTIPHTRLPTPRAFDVF